MDSDLSAFSSFAFTLLLAGAFFAVGYLWESRLTLRAARLLLKFLAVLLAIPAFLYAVYYLHILDSAVWFYNLRALPHSELLASGAGFLAGICQANWHAEGTSQKFMIPLGLFLVLVAPFLKQVLDPLDYTSLRNDCPGDVCLQSTPSTCGPSSAATILRSFGDPASERELAAAARTSHGGTEIWYLARALRRRGYRTEVVIQRGATPLPHLPAIAGVVLPGGGGHFIAILSQDEHNVVLADPLRGKSSVAQLELSATYHFTGFFLTIERR